MVTAIGPWTYRWEDVPRPFVHPVRTPAGRTVSVDGPADHPWQHALWFTIKFVNGENFWEEYGEFGRLRQVDAPTLSWAEGAEDGPGRRVRADSSVDWVRPDGHTVVASHELSLTHVALGSPQAHALDWDVRFTPKVDVTLDRTPYTTWGGYGGLTLRGRPDWHDTELRVSEAAGGVGSHPQLLGTRARWCALDGPVTDPDGDHEVGVALLDHPANPGHPVPWYASTRQPAYEMEGWTNFLNAAFLWDGPMDVSAAETLRLRYRFVVHDGRWSPDDLDATWVAWEREA